MVEPQPIMIDDDNNEVSVVAQEFEIEPTRVHTFDPNVSQSANTRGPNREGFKVLTGTEKLTIFENKRDDLFYKTFGRTVRKFLQDDFIAMTGYDKELKGTDGSYYQKNLRKYAKVRNFHKDQPFDLDRMV